MSRSRLSALDERSIIRPRTPGTQLTSIQPRPSKRLILCEDGSWLNAQSNSLKNSLAIPSNVTRLSRAVKAHSRDGIPQVVYYHFGVGASGGIVDKIYGGISGDGLAEIVREGYDFVSSNYVLNDEIFLFGFSRGAFTARSIAGLIGEIGVLTKDGLPYFAEIFRDVQHMHDPNYVPKHPDLPFPDKPSASDPRYRYELQKRGLTRLSVSIKIVGVWDTVGSLGTPKVGWLQRVGLQSSVSKQMSFYDTSLSNCIENAFQALALDERRYSFQPAVWEKLNGNTTILRQVWFPGAHSNIGGGYDDQQIATISFAWMVAQCQPFIDFDIDYVLDQWEAAEDYYGRHEQRTRPWSFGKIFSGMTGFYALGGEKVRTPGRNYAVDPNTGRQTDDPLRDTHEYIHPCVRARIKLGGLGLEDKGRYECKALEDWKLYIEYGENSKRPNIFWKLRTKEKNVSTRVLPEAPLWQLEREIIEYDLETEDYVMNPSAVRQKRTPRSRKGDKLSRDNLSRSPSRNPSRRPSRRRSTKMSRYSESYSRSPP
ncbi:hypothetical protein K431DRAFT_229884 [Polychaeton citri CBS 116435]|uniref:T6SS Phospholipase effector Tle1-like catalytic domain-containing protein n=1 Tax=Polychaeton citri CBS 116435 TaxID=1314669 RepID=A0A9P4Q3U8_9PEZI|nr:hypothetical protein K431DRAFT_229884 [Polychaeton citri CBS 116435]